MWCVVHLWSWWSFLVVPSESVIQQNRIVPCETLTVVDIARIVRDGRLPWSLEAVLAHLRTRLRADRPERVRRTWSVLRAYTRYEAAVRELALRTTTRDNHAALYRLVQHQARRSEIDDVTVLRTHNDLLAHDAAVVQQTTVCRDLVIELLEAGLYLDVTEGDDGDTATGGGVDPPGK